MAQSSKQRDGAPIMTPTLSGTGIVLRGFVEADAAAVAAAYDDRAMRQWHRKDLRKRDAAAAWVGEQMAASARSASWAVVDPRTRTLVGQVALRAVDRAAGGASVGYWVVAAHRGHGVAVRALQPLLRWAFADLGLHRLELSHSTRNPASCSVAVSAGFRYERTRRAHLLHADGWHDMHLHARLADDPKES